MGQIIDIVGVEATSLIVQVEVADPATAVDVTPAGRLSVDVTTGGTSVIDVVVDDAPLAVDILTQASMAVDVIAADIGEQGPPGPEGPMGPVGPTGATGARGLTGVTGPEGPEGPQGQAGAKGDKGDTGPEGPEGPKGLKGDTGAQGPQGVKGDTGMSGGSGAPGATGPAGPPGPAGADSTVPGPPGIQGPTGSPGAPQTPSDNVPSMDGTGTPGGSVLYTRGDHVHPTDTTREPTIAAGTTAQYYRGDKAWTTLDKTAVGLANVDNTSDASKPVSTATQTALNLKADLASPTFTGDPKAPTPTVGDADTSIATTAFVGTAVTNAAVRYDAAQTLTSAQMSRARANINVTKRNYIINGGMMISQENGTTASTGVGNYYPVDMFYRWLGSTTGVTTAAQIVSATPGGSSNRLRTTVTTADATLGAGEVVAIICAVEGLRAVDLKCGAASAKTITIQFGVKAPAGTYCIAVSNYNADRTYVAEYVITGGEANTDVVKSVTLTLDTTGTWPADNTGQLWINWTLMCGSTWQTSAGAWTSSNKYGSANQFNFMGTINNIFELFDVSLTEGSTAPPFQLPDYATELELCKRYWRTSLNVFGQFGGNSTTVYNTGPLTPEMRVAPTYAVKSGAGAINEIGVAARDINAVTNAGSSSASFYFTVTTTTAGTINNRTILNVNAVTLNARL